MGLLTTDVVLINRAGALYRCTVAEFLALVSASPFNAVEVNLGSPGKRSGKFTIAGTGLTVGKPVQVWLAPGPYTGKGATNPDEVQLYEMDLTGIVTSSTVITVFWSSRFLTRGNVKFNYLIGA